MSIQPHSGRIYMTFAIRHTTHITSLCIVCPRHATTFEERPKTLHKYCTNYCLRSASDIQNTTHNMKSNPHTHSTESRTESRGRTAPRVVRLCFGVAGGVRRTLCRSHRTCGTETNKSASQTSKIEKHRPQRQRQPRQPASTQRHSRSHSMI